MKKNISTILFAMVSFVAMADNVQLPSYTEWHDMQVNELNRLPVHTSFFPFADEAAAIKNEPRESESYLSLNGTWRFRWVENADERPAEFYLSDLDDSWWNAIQVPGMWELQGYGDPIYVNSGFGWNGHFKNNPPEVPVKDNHVGSYRRWVDVPAAWDGRQVIIHFGSVTSNIYLYVNGRFVGYAEDSKVAAEFDVTPYLKPGKNLIAFQTFRWCDGSYCEDQDFWRFSGVARDSYLYCRDRETHVDDIRITSDLIDNYKNGYLKIATKATGNATVGYRLLDADGKVVATASGLEAEMTLDGCRTWTAETPYLYTLVAEVKAPATTKGKGRKKTVVEGKTVEYIAQKVGFRKVEIKGDRFLVNGQPIYIKGVNRHEMDPDGGYVVSRERMVQDLTIMKRLNINAIRTCHYPSDPYLYDLCDKYGFYMIAEANQESHGFEFAKDAESTKPIFAQQIMERNQHNLAVNFNHPAVVIWSMGNETADGPNFTAVFKWIKTQDTGRPIHWQPAWKGENTELFCPMYFSQENCQKYVDSDAAEDQKPLIQCEYSHAMGNSCGGFKEYWNIVRQNKCFQGGFIWDFVDQGIRRNSGYKEAPIVGGEPKTDGDGSKKLWPSYSYGGDFNDYDVNHNNFNCNGLISPDRVLNPHAYEVAYYYQDIWTTVARQHRDHVELQIASENFFRPIDDVRMEWTLVVDGEEVKKGSVESLTIAPRGTATVVVPVKESEILDESYLNVDYFLTADRPLMKRGQRVAYQQLKLKKNIYICGFNKVDKSAFKNFKIVDKKGTDAIVVSTKDATLTFARSTGLISSYQYRGTELLADEGTLRPNFWRAPTDNDMGAGLQKKYAVWKNPKMNLVSLQSVKANKKQGVGPRVIATYDMPDVTAQLTVGYTLNTNGSITVSQNMQVSDTAKVVDMFRFGMVMQLPKQMDKSEYYGRGPMENYIDRELSQRVGIYRQTAREQFYPYIRPQETGTKTGIRWWRQCDSKGVGIKVSGAKHLSMSALPYSIEKLDDGDYRHQRHPDELEEDDFITLVIDDVQMGVGGINSWGALPLEEHRVHYQNRQFSFTICPTQGK
ncbi:MAG: DUF4981 domain-containing protein [Prevotella sp.]|nr:DUF4981 domain-containing protein [Prevotella sp.]